MNPSSNTITPPEIDTIVEDFCAKVSPGNSPVYVDVIPRAEAIQDECFFNVQDVVRKKGGRIMY